MWQDLLIWSFAVQPLSRVQLFCFPMDCSLPGYSVHGISQARIVESVAISIPRVSSLLRDQTCISWVGKQILYCWAIREIQNGQYKLLKDTKVIDIMANKLLY